MTNFVIVNKKPKGQRSLTWEPACHKNILNTSQVPESKHFFRRSKAANSAEHGCIWPKFELIQDFTVVLVICKMKKMESKMKGARVFTAFIY